MTRALERRSSASSLATCLTTSWTRLKSPSAVGPLTGRGGSTLVTVVERTRDGSLEFLEGRELPGIAALLDA